MSDASGLTVRVVISPAITQILWWGVAGYRACLDKKPAHVTWATIKQLRVDYFLLNIVVFTPRRIHHRGRPSHSGLGKQWPQQCKDVGGSTRHGSSPANRTTANWDEGQRFLLGQFDRDLVGRFRPGRIILETSDEGDYSLVYITFWITPWRVVGKESLSTTTQASGHL